jgi:hypothetical protein
MSSQPNQILILRAYYVNVLYEHRKCLKEWFVKSVPNTLQQQKCQSQKGENQKITQRSPQHHKKSLKRITPSQKLHRTQIKF